MGDLKSQFKEIIDMHIKNGTIVPVEITCALLEKAINKRMANTGDNLGGDVSSEFCRNFLIDGFPRNENNLDGWRKAMTGKTDVKFVLFFDCPESISLERCLKRGQTGSGRTDDNEESMKKRLVTYFNDTLPIIKYYETLGMVKRIDASPHPDQVFSEVKKLFVNFK